MSELVWIPATPEPFQGATLPLFRTKLVCWTSVPDTPYGVLTPRRCGRKFTGPEAHETYEQHWHRDHASYDHSNTQMQVSAERALALGYFPSDLPRTSAAS